jgi:hypothetical protein
MEQIIYNRKYAHIQIIGTSFNKIYLLKFQREIDSDRLKINTQFIKN